jgi:hypothetical protein
LSTLSNFRLIANWRTCNASWRDPFFALRCCNRQPQSRWFQGGNAPGRVRELIGNRRITARIDLLQPFSLPKTLLPRKISTAIPYQRSRGFSSRDNERQSRECLSVESSCWQRRCRVYRQDGSQAPCEAHARVSPLQLPAHRKEFMVNLDISNRPKEFCRLNSNHFFIPSKSRPFQQINLCSSQTCHRCKLEKSLRRSRIIRRRTVK